MAHKTSCRSSKEKRKQNKRKKPYRTERWYDKHDPYDLSKAPPLEDEDGYIRAGNLNNII